MTLSLWKSEPPLTPRETAAGIVSGIASAHNLKLADLTGDRRTRHIAHARQEAMWKLHRKLEWSLPRIGRFLGGRDHTTVLYGVRAHERRLAEASGDAP